MSEQEFEKFLDSLRREQPCQAALESWKLAVHDTKNQMVVRRKHQRFSMLQLVAASLVGVVIGGLLSFSFVKSGHLNPKDGSVESPDFATYEYVHSKS